MTYKVLKNDMYKMKRSDWTLIIFSVLVGILYTAAEILRMIKYNF